MFLVLPAGLIEVAQAAGIAFQKVQWIHDPYSADLQRPLQEAGIVSGRNSIDPAHEVHR